MLKMVNRMKIKHKLILIMLLLTGIVCAGFVVAMTLSFKTYDEMLYDHASRAMNLSVSGIENEIGNIEKLSVNMALDSRIQEQLINIRGVLSSYERVRRMTDFKSKVLQYMLTEKSISSIRFLNTEGYNFFVGQNNVTNDEKLVQDIVDKAHLREGAGVWIESGDDLISAREIRSIFDPILEPLGTLIFRVDYDGLVERHFRPTMNQSAQLFVISNSGVLYRPNGEAFKSFSIESVQFPEEQGFLLEKIEGKTYFLAYTRSSSTGWKYISLTPYDDIFQKKRAVRNTIITIVVIMVAVASVISYMFARTLTRPIVLLTNQMRNVEKGDWSVSTLETNSVPRMDEIGYLHKRFQNMVRNIEQLIDENYKKQIVIKDTEYRALQAQINPHFLYNTLSSINWMARSNNDEIISTMVESLSRIFRVSIDDKRTMVTIREELELIEGYMYIQKVRYADKIEFVVDVPEEVMASQIPKFTLQPIVENAIHHAVDQMIDVCRIAIKAEIDEENQELTFIISDTGPGMDMTFLEALRQFNVEAKGTGIGLKNIYDRLQIIYGERYHFEIESALSEGTSIRITIPKGEDSYV
ncbi:cache domain-containing sensor histidine kinase [Paenibacillus sinopodophylli]|uniref:cache domain-containing sensor histidine kinase n=1 Tax=Paenibacillus sinopodophylli TaxID=1837342 RepID=UPI0014874DD4|nr:sensor histidine kinase [Paenibacillus sinopodophylli]